VSNVQGMDALIKRMKAIGETKPAMRAVQLSAVHEAHALVPRRTGLLQHRIVPGRVSDTEAVIEARTPYAAAVEYGSKPHIIRPKRAKVLAWGGPRRLSGNLRSGAKPTNFAALVHHPGSKAHAYLVPGAKRALEKAGILASIVDQWNKSA
jgi:hypothetical protein